MSINRSFPDSSRIESVGVKPLLSRPKHVKFPGGPKTGNKYEDLQTVIVH